jgi:hypothetical protein
MVEHCFWVLVMELSIWIIYTTKQSIDIIFEKWREENGYREKYSEKVSVNIKGKDYIKYPTWIHSNIIIK